VRQKLSKIIKIGLRINRRRMMLFGTRRTTVQYFSFFAFVIVLNLTKFICAFSFYSFSYYVIGLLYYPRKFWWLHQHSDYHSMCVWFALSRGLKTWSYLQFTRGKYIRQLIFAAWAWMWIIISHRICRCWRSRHWFFPRADVTLSSTIYNVVRFLVVRS